MEIKKQPAQVFLVFVPHRDTRQELKKYSDTLIKNGLNGVYGFPQAVPLAELSEPLTADELKHFARFLRETIGKDKINTSKPTITTFPVNWKEMALFGPELNLNIPANTLNSKKTVFSYSPLIIGTFLIPEAKENLRISIPLCEDLNCLSFRAAAVANMFWQPFKKDGETCFRWKIGKLCWLPRPSSKKAE